MSGQLNRTGVALVRLRFGSNDIVYDSAGQTLDGMPLPLEGGKLRVRVVVDRPLYEVVGGGGAVYKTATAASRSSRCGSGRSVGRRAWPR